MASTVAVSALPRPPRLHPAPVTMASRAAVSATSMPPRLHYPTAAVASPIRAVMPNGRRQNTASVDDNDRLHRDSIVVVPIQAIGPVNGNRSIFKLTLDLSKAPSLKDWYDTPGQYVQARPARPRGMDLASMEIASATKLNYFDLLVRSVPGTTAEQLCGLTPNDEVQLKPTGWKGFPVDKILEAETVLYFAVAEGLSPIRALIKSGYTKNVKLYYGARNKESVPLQGEISEWKQAGLDVIEVLDEPVQNPFLKHHIIKNPHSTVAVLVGPYEMQQELQILLTSLGVPGDNIVTVPGWYPDY